MLTRCSWQCSVVMETQKSALYPWKKLTPVLCWRAFPYQHRYLLCVWAYVFTLWYFYNHKDVSPRVNLTKPVKSIHARVIFHILLIFFRVITKSFHCGHYFIMTIKDVFTLGMFGWVKMNPGAIEV